MTRYAISHATIGISYVAVSQADPTKQPEVLKLASNEAKEKFLVKQLQPGDDLYCENGGASDRIALIGLARGCKVYRVPTFRIGTGKVTQDGEITDTPLAKRVKAMGWKVVEEPSAGKETSHDLTVRRTRAVAINAMSLQCLHEFLVVGDPEKRALELKRLYRSYRASQKVLLTNYQRLLANYADRALLVLVAEGTEGSVTGDRISSEKVREAMNELLVDIPEKEREQFVARMGLEKFFAKSMIPRKDVRKLFKAIIDEMMNGTVMSPFLQSMKGLVKDMKTVLASDKIHEHVFAPLPGCGPLIAARMMAAIVDIRRFRSAAALKAYAGYHHFEDGSRARRKAGQASNWEQELKQAVYLWTQQTIKLKDSPWRAKLDRRRAYELYKLLLERQEQADDMNYKEQILPREYFERKIDNTYDMELADLEKLATHVDALRKKAGVKSIKDADEELSEEELAAMADARAKHPELAKLTRGLKKSALDKSYRWLGQQLLKHIFKAWTHALTLPEIPAKTKGRRISKPAAEAPKRKRTRTKKASKDNAKSEEKAPATQVS